MKRQLLGAAVFLLGTSHAFAVPTPRVTEIRLKDHTVFAPMEREVIFRQDDSIDLVRGTGEKATHARYVLRRGEFQRLVELLSEQHFFSLKPIYSPELPEPSLPHDQQVVDSSYFIVSATRNGQERAVRFNQSGANSTFPRNLWMIEQILRGEIEKVIG